MDHKTEQSLQALFFELQAMQVRIMQCMSKGGMSDRINAELQLGCDNMKTRLTKLAGAGQEPQRSSAFLSGMTHARSCKGNAEKLKASMECCNQEVRNKTATDFDHGFKHEVDSWEAK